MTTNPTTPDQGDERRAFEALWELYARVGDAHENHGRNHERTMKAREVFYEALRAALAAPQPSQGAEAREAIAWSLRFDDDPRLNLSTVFDTEDEAKKYAERCGSATPVPLYAAPPQPVSAEGSMLRELLARIHGDGGHYVAQHGLDRAVEDADMIVSNLFASQAVSAEAGKGVINPLEQGWPAWSPDAVDALVMLDRLDVRDDQGRVDAIEQCVRRMAEALKPSAVSGEVSEEQIDAVWDGLPGVKIHNEATSRGLKTEVLLRRYFAKAVLALAGSGEKV